MTPLSEKQHPHHELYRRIGVVVWVSFVAAGIATALFFATFDFFIYSFITLFGFKNNVLLLKLSSKTKQ